MTQSFPPAPEAPQAYRAPAPQQPIGQLPTTVAQTNTFALVSIIVVFFQPIAGIVFGHLGLSQIKRQGDAGRGIALTAVILGYAAVLAWVMIVIAYVGLIMVAIATFPTSFDPYMYDELYG